MLVGWQVVHGMAHLDVREACRLQGMCEPLSGTSPVSRVLDGDAQLLSHQLREDVKCRQ